MLLTHLDSYMKVTYHLALPLAKALVTLFGCLADVKVQTKYGLVPHRQLQDKLCERCHMKMLENMFTCW